MVWLVMVLIGSTLLSLLVWVQHSRGIKVVVLNTTNATILDLKVSFTGGSFEILRLEAGHVFKTRINPTGESHLDVKWADSNGTQYSEAGGGYFERNYRGRIEIEIQPAGVILWKTDVKLPLL